MKTNKLYLVAIAILMVTMGSCKSIWDNAKEDIYTALSEREAPITFTFDNIKYSNNIQFHKPFSNKFENNFSPYNEIGYELSIKREGFTNTSNNRKAILHLVFINETENSIILGEPYPLHTGSNVALYYTSYHDDTTEIYHVKEGYITFTEIQQEEVSLWGEFEFTTIDANNIEKQIVGTFENLGIHTYGCLDIIDSGKVLFTI